MNIIVRKLMETTSHVVAVGGGHVGMYPAYRSAR